jgi:hypothetical protein
MARKFLTPIDLNKLELQNARVQNLASAPASPVTGQIYYDTTLNYLRTWNGSAWINTSQGIQGTTGTTGAQGTTGTTGAQGTTGTTGAQGTTGTQGTQGITGDTGAQGTTGTQGTQGTQGNTGNTGAQGTTGTQGVQGITGNTGNTGAQGTTGTQGLTGTTGAQGTTGTTGSQGTTGTTGAQGTTGTTGLQGTDGTQGTQGITGNTGIQGTTGTTGAQGIQGTNAGILSVGSGLSLNGGTGELTVDTTTIATRAYVDATAQGLDVKQSVRVATTADGYFLNAFSATAVIDGVTLVQGDRILIKNQASGAENGIYTVGSSGTAPTRATDADISAEVTAGMFTFVEEGTANADSGWVLTTDQPITLGATALVFTQFSGTGQITAGTGLTKTGNTLNVGAGTGILANADDVAIDTSVVVRKYSATITPVNPYSDTTFTLTHSLGTTDIQVTVYEISSSMEVITDVTYITSSTVTIGFAVAPAAGETYRVVVHA